MKLRYTITLDLDTTDISTLDEAINQYNFCMRYQDVENFISDLISNNKIDVEVTGIEEL